MNWNLRVTHAAGDTRFFPLNAIQKLSFRDDAFQPENIRFKLENADSEVPHLRIQNLRPDSFVSVGGIVIQEAAIPPNVPIRLGSSVLEVVRPLKNRNAPVSTVKGCEWKTENPECIDLLWSLRKASQTPLSISIEGETGTGKDVLARMIHGWSPRSGGPFIALNCGALPLSLVESELFGHTKGAFTGALNSRAGALVQAHNGTLFLDEVADLPLDVQVKLLRFLENGEVRAVGSDHVSRSNARIICATHKPLKTLVAEKQFRQDLYFRLASIAIEVPALRDRKEDVVMLAKEFALTNRRTLSPRALMLLQTYFWPGNVRELKHAIDRASALASDFSSILTDESFQFLINSETLEKTPDIQAFSPMLSLDEMQKIMLLRALKLCEGNRTEAAKLLGIARSTLFEMLKRYRIKGPRMRPTAQELLKNKDLRSGLPESIH